MGTRDIDRRNRRNFAIALWALTLGCITVPLSLGAQEEPSSPEAWTGFWLGERKQTRLQLRLGADGTYEVEVVWVSPEAEERARGMEGERIVRGLTWDERNSRFAGGTARMERNGRTSEVSCELQPRGDGTLEFRAVYGILSRSVVWVRE